MSGRAWAARFRGAVVTGTVSNSATHSALEGAVVEMVALGRQTLTDRSGQFAFRDLPAGSYELTVSYLGLDSARQTTRASDDARASVEFSLTTAIYQLQQFVVTGEREGGAAAITQQRNAANVKNVVAMDSFGNLPNLSAGELAEMKPEFSWSSFGQCHGHSDRIIAPHRFLDKSDHFAIVELHGALEAAVEVLVGQCVGRGIPERARPLHLLRSAENVETR